MPAKKRQSVGQLKSKCGKRSSPRTALETAKAEIEEVFALAKEGNFSGIDRLVACLKDESWSVRSSAAHYLGRIGPQDAISALATVAKADPEPETRNVAIYALAGVGRGACISPLIECLNDLVPARRDDARTALVRIVGDQIASLLADDMELFDDSTGQPGRDPEEVDRVKAWFDETHDRIAPERAYFFGIPAHPRVLIDRLRDNPRRPTDAITRSLEDWTGESFKATSAQKTLQQWEKWLEGHGAGYQEGTRYFYGYSVD